MPEEKQTIGNANGWQLILFRVNLIAIPVLLSASITLATWIIGKVYDVQATNKVQTEQLRTLVGRLYTVNAARADLLQTRAEILDVVFDKLPPQELLEDVKSLKHRVSELERKSP